jgi:hypothetical protein
MARSTSVLVNALVIENMLNTEFSASGGCAASAARWPSPWRPPGLRDFDHDAVIQPGPDIRTDDIFHIDKTLLIHTCGCHLNPQSLVVWKPRV